MKKWMEVILVLISIGILVLLNVLWIIGFNGELRTTALTFDIAFVTLILDKFRRNFLGGNNG